MDALAQYDDVIALDYQGVGQSTGQARETIEAMADDVLAFVSTLELTAIRVVGFSLGGFVEQQLLLKAPERFTKCILEGTGGAGGEGIDRVTRITIYDILRGRVTLRDPKHYLFFPVTPAGQQAARDFIARIKRTEDRDPPIKLSAFLAQLRAISVWANREKDDLSKITIPVWVVNGDNDRMVPTQNSYDLANRIPGAKHTIYPHAGHGAIFQYHEDFVNKALEF